MRALEWCGDAPTLIGDLQEEADGGRPARWVCWQATVAVFVTVVARPRVGLAPLRVVRVAIFGVLLVVGTLGLRAQVVRDQFTLIDRSPTADGERDVIRAVDVLRPRSATNWHSHPGEMVGFVTDGTVLIEQEGQSPLSINAGESFLIGAGVAHRSRNPSTRHARMFVTFFIKAGWAMSRGDPTLNR